MDRNLGATQAATSSTDVDAYGDLYQWGRFSDGHQCRTSATNPALSSTDQPAHGDFITVNSGNYDWRSPQNDNLWQGVNGINNPCPSGYRFPTEAELEAERLSWSSAQYSGGGYSLTRLNCPWRATAAAAMVRSTMSVPTATIGAVRLVALSRASSTSTASMPTWATAPERAETLCVASRINPKRSVSELVP